MLLLLACAAGPTPGQAPELTILSPLDGALFAEGVPVRVEVAVVDDLLDDVSVNVWARDPADEGTEYAFGRPTLGLDGVGNVELTNLPVGPIELFSTVIDADLLQDADRVEVEVLPA